MNIQQSVQTCVVKYADFSGRASRSEYWWFILAQVVAMVVAGLINQYLSTFVSLALLLPTIAAGVRRLHDIGKSGWFMLIGVIPFINLVLVYFLAQPGQSEANVHGELVTT
jgi:uncharacterized membrane protein YhaH (DUF805 family)